jgi:hypothetical protein
MQSLRGVTLPNPEVMAMLQERFIVGARNIEREEHVGLSQGYSCSQTAVGTTNGAGGRNVQILVLAADETVVHALPGFWHAEDLCNELRLGLELYRLYLDEDLTPAQKQAMAAVLHRAHLRLYGDEEARRGDWQGFDRQYELERANKETRDTVTGDTACTRALKTIPEIVHERLIARSFKRLADFGMETFVDYGRPYYDNNGGIDRGRTFPRAVAVNAKREHEQELAEKQAQKQAEKLAKAAKTTKNGDKAAATGKSGWTPPAGPAAPGPTTP